MMLNVLIETRCHWTRFNSMQNLNPVLIRLQIEEIWTYSRFYVELSSQLEYTSFEIGFKHE